MIGERGRDAIVAGTDGGSKGKTGKLIHEKVAVLLLGGGMGDLVTCTDEEVGAEFLLYLLKGIYPSIAMRSIQDLRVTDKGELKITKGYGRKIVEIGLLTVVRHAVYVIGTGCKVGKGCLMGVLAELILCRGCG